MRITDHILSNTSQKTGVLLSGNTLASQLNGNASDSLVNSLGNKGSSTLKGMSEEKYRKWKEAAGELEKSAERLRKTGKNSLFEKAREDDDSSEVYQTVKDMISGYNDLMNRLRTDTSGLGMFYRQSLQEVVTEKKDALAEIGIAVDKNGNLKLDQEKLKTADLDKLESLLGGKGTLTEKLAFIAGKVVDNADANLKSTSNQYDAKGSSVDTLLRSFDSKG